MLAVNFSDLANISLSKFVDEGLKDKKQMALDGLNNIGKFLLLLF